MAQFAYASCCRLFCASGISVQIGAGAYRNRQIGAVFLTAQINKTAQTQPDILRYNIPPTAKPISTRTTDALLIIDRYLTQEILRPFMLGFGLLVVLFVAYTAAIQLTQAADGVIEPTTAMRLILLNTLIALETLLPSALYLSIVAAIGRLHQDSEMTAMQAAGISELRIMAAVAKLALVFAVLVAVLSIFGRPWAYGESYRLESQLVDDFDITTLTADRFIKLQDSGYVLYARVVDREQKRLHDVFMQADRGPKSEIILAEEAYLPETSTEEDRKVKFLRGHLYLLNREGPGDGSMAFKELITHIPEAEKLSSYKRKAEPTASLAASDQPKDIAEFQWRVSTPLATILLALLAVPLSRSQPRQSRFGIFFSAIVVYALLLGLIGALRNAIEQGTLSAVPGLWSAYLFPLVLLALLLILPKLKK